MPLFPVTTTGWVPVTSPPCCAGQATKSCRSISSISWRVVILTVGCGSEETEVYGDEWVEQIQFLHRPELLFAALWPD